ncbi:MAG: hypothetical protein WAO61_06140 [Solirubrobacterales bacterium]
MDSNDNQINQGTTLRDALNVLSRRRWVVLICVVLVPLSALAFSLRQEATYQGEAEVLLSRQNLANSLTDTPDPNAQAGDGDRIAQTQSQLAVTPEIARRTLRRLRIYDRTAADLLENTEVTTAQNSDILVFKVTDQDRRTAAELVNEYARQYTLFRAELDTKAVSRALGEVTDRVAALEAEGDRRSDLHASLIDKQQQLRTLEALQTSNAFVVREEDDAEQVRPTPLRNVTLGLILGSMLGVALAFVFDALDTRLRTAEEIASALGLPLLVRVPLQRKRRADDPPVMLTHPRSPEAETYRLLRSNLEFSSLGNDLRTVMVTSAVEQEGKSTTIANLAVAWARAGTDVVLVDLDLRRPVIEKYFDLQGRPGVTNVALRKLRLEDALVEIPLEEAPAEGALPEFGSSSEFGSLKILPCGAIPPDPGEFIGTAALARILVSLRSSAEIVLVDAPPMLRVGDPMALAARVDGLIVVGRVGVLHSGMAKELRRQLQTAPAHLLGVVVIGDGGSDGGYGYGYEYGYGEALGGRAGTAVSEAEEGVPYGDDSVGFGAGLTRD